MWEQEPELWDRDFISRKFRQLAQQNFFAVTHHTSCPPVTRVSEAVLTAFVPYQSLLLETASGPGAITGDSQLISCHLEFNTEDVQYDIQALAPKNRHPKSSSELNRHSSRTM